MEEYVSRREHDEFAKRMEEEHARQNTRIKGLEEDMKQFGSLTISVNTLANNMQKMLEEQKDQGERLEELESRDGEMWRKVVGYIITAVIGIVLGVVAKEIGL